MHRRRLLRRTAIAALAFVGTQGAAVAQSATPPGLAVERTIADAKAAMLVDPDAARATAGQAERMARGIADPKARGVAIATAQWLQGEAYLRNNAIANAAPLIERALATVKTVAPSTKLHADVLLSRGGIEQQTTKVGRALNDYQAAFEIYRKLADNRSQAIALIYIASLYNEAMDQTNALRYYAQALDTYKSDINLSVSIYNNIGSALRDMGAFDKASARYAEALALARQLKSPTLESQILNNIARTKLAQGDLDAADEALRAGTAAATSGATGDARSQLIATAAQSALQRHRPQRAALLIARAFEGVDPATTTLSYRDMHNTAYQTFLAVGNLDAALVHLRAHKRLDDNATRLAIDASTALMGARFDFANQELKISQLKASELERGIAFERARAKTQRYAFLGASVAITIVIGLLAFALFTVRRSRDKIHAANADLAVTNSALGKALAAKTEFLATTSHEIRTPLNGILGMTEVILADAALSAALRDRLNIVHGAGVTMRALVDDILDVAKMETGNLSIESAPFDLRATVVEATRMWEEQARAKGLGFDVDLDDCPTLIVGDAARVRQIVFNLLSNALKFTATGRVAVSAGVTKDDTLRIAVSDSGIGIPPEKLDEIFESFRQADAGTTRQFGGTGLGLAICRNLARAMGGDVSVGSVVGSGATFTLLLPLVRAEPLGADEGQAEADRTLVIDRNPISRMTLRSLLAPRGGDIVFAGTVDEAVARLREGGIARLLIDDATVCAAGDPHAALRTIAAAGTGADTTLLWSGDAATECEELLETGVDRVILKPITGAALVTAMFDRSVSNKDAIPDLVSRAA